DDGVEPFCQKPFGWICLIPIGIGRDRGWATVKTDQGPTHPVHLKEDLTMQSLAHAIRSNAKSLAAAQNTYKQNVVAVNTVMTSVLTSTLPALHQNPPDWNDFVAAFEQANGDALNWVNNVMARLLNVPHEVIGYNDVISQVLQDAKTQAQNL